VIAVDTNILVYAQRENAQWHDIAHGDLMELAERAEGRTPWAIPWPCLHEFLAIVTHPRIYALPTPAGIAVDQVEAWLESPSLTMLSESEGYWPDLRMALHEGRIVGPQVHGARVAALCRLHGVRELWTIDRDFGRFPWLTPTNPLVG
jgi:toxin-antitoxin system PIN domain toxin